MGILEIMGRGGGVRKLLQVGIMNIDGVKLLISHYVDHAVKL